MSIIIKIGLGFYKLVYFFMKLFPTRRKIVFLSRQSDVPSIDIKLLSKELNRSHKDYQVIILCKKIGPGIYGKVSYCMHMFRQAWHLATSQVAILDSYCILASCLKHKPKLLIIQMWHSVGTMKKFGYSILDKPEGSSSKIANAMHMHRNYDYMLASSPAYKAHLAEGFNQNVNQIVTLALPRVELLKDSDYGTHTRDGICSTYPELLNGNKNIVYCPTFRKGKDESTEFQNALDDFISKLDLNKYNLILKLHPLSNFDINFDIKAKGVIDDHTYSTFNMLYVADMVISDYSCVIYEAAVLNKPLYFYTYDYDKYMSTRDIYMDYNKEIPGPICSNADELVKALEQPYDMKRLKAFSDKYVSPECHDETKSIIEFIFSHIK